MADSPRVYVLMGSDSDLPVMEPCLATLAKFDVPYEAKVCSAHRTPDEAAALSRGARERGVQVIIAAAAGAAHLAGVLAAHTTLPVIGVPLDATPLHGADALYATVQMPPGVPVATVAIGAFGAYNAAVLAVQIMALSEERLQRKLEEFKKDMVVKVREKNEQLQSKLKRPAP
ncbi:MAG: 5-(carboxyamino)imidazole ribonucleotide mutase [Planctomycetota bacterium]|nr:5-(carboxyamino)imidazole ribonucleotide mutase [Planctomycetota bacterium]